MSDRRQERGSALLLIPAFLLVLLAAAALVVDAGIGFAAKRELVETAAAAANDAAAAMDDATFYRAGNVRLDPAMAQRLAVASVARRRSTLVPDATVDVSISVTANGEPAIDVVATGSTRLLFARFLPARASTITLHATARATARRRAPD